MYALVDGTTLRDIHLYTVALLLGSLKSSGSGGNFDMLVDKLFMGRFLSGSFLTIDM